MTKKNLKLLMVVIVLVPVALTAYLAKTLYERQGVPQAVESLAKQLFKSKEEERQASEQVRELEKKAGELKTAYDALLAELQGEVDSKDVRIRRFQGKIEINFVDKVLFVSGSAEITPRGQTVLGKVGQVLGKVKDRRFFVVGHTDDVPIRSFVFPSNWELSTARASSVIRFLSDRHGVDPARFTALGRAFYQPVASNDTPEGRQENRRVEIIIADLPLFEGEGADEMRSPVASPSGAAAGPLESSAPRERSLTLPEADLPKGVAPAAPAGQSPAPGPEASPATPAPAESGLAAPPPPASASPAPPASADQSSAPADAARPAELPESSAPAAPTTPAAVADPSPAGPESSAAPAASPSAAATTSAQPTPPATTAP